MAKNKIPKTKRNSKEKEVQEKQAQFLDANYLVPALRLPNSIEENNEYFRHAIKAWLELLGA